MLIRLTSGNVDFAAFKTDGTDIRFAKPNGSPLPYEIEQWDASMGPAQKFDGQSEYFQMTGTASGKLNFPQNSVYAISAWALTDTLDGHYHTIASKGDFQYNLELIKSNYWQFAEFNPGVGWDVATFPATAKTWTYVTGIRNGKSKYLYVNGSLADSTIEITPDTVNPWKSNFDFMIGKIEKSPTDTISYFFKGMIDEVRITSTVPNADWVKLCYMNQRPDDKLVRVK